MKTEEEIKYPIQGWKYPEIDSFIEEFEEYVDLAFIVKRFNVPSYIVSERAKRLGVYFNKRPRYLRAVKLFMNGEMVSRKISRSPKETMLLLNQNLGKTKNKFHYQIEVLS